MKAILNIRKVPIKSDGKIYIALITYLCLITKAAMS
jgi:hypothetical protein